MSGYPRRSAAAAGLLARDTGMYRTLGMEWAARNSRCCRLSRAIMSASGRAQVFPSSWLIVEATTISVSVKVSAVSMPSLRAKPTGLADGDVGFLTRCHRRASRIPSASREGHAFNPPALGPLARSGAEREGTPVQR